MPQTSQYSGRTCVSWLWTSWGWEFAACFLVLATPIIIFGTLYPHSGQPLPKWPFKVSINSLISVYALVLKACIGFILTSCIGQLQWTWFSETRPLTDMLHFDNATRGADGALGLIWWQRFRQPLTALGCVIMVLTVTVEPFVQQLVRPVDCSIEVSDGSAAATLPRTNVFEYYGYNGNTDKNGSTQSRMDLKVPGKDIENALYNAVFSPGQYKTWKCSTGNCTFPDTYGTLGFCSSCRDASAHVTINATCSHPDSSYASLHPTSSADCPKNSNFTIESSFTASETINLRTEMTIPKGLNTIIPAVADAYADIQPGMSKIFGGPHSVLFGFLIGATANTGGQTDWTTSDNSTCDSDESEESWRCLGYGAATCSLQPCVQIYNATISAGILEEHLVTSSSDTDWGVVYGKNGLPSYLALIDTQCSSEVQAMPNQNLTMGSRWLPYDINLADPDGSPYNTDPEIDLPDNDTSLLDSGCLYLMSTDGIMSNMRGLLRGTVHAGGYSIKQDSQTGEFEVSDMTNFDGPEIIRSIYNWGHTDLDRVQSIFSNISDSLSEYIRTHGGTQQRWDSTNLSKEAQGVVYHYATCLQVEWPWLSFPAFLAISTAAFFLTVVEATRRRGTSVWKASPLAWVLRASRLDHEQSSTSTTLREGMKEKSRQIAVHLLDEDRDGPRIRMTDIKDPNLL